MGSRSVTCYPKQVNQPHLNPARQPEGWKTELSYVEKFREHRQPTKSVTQCHPVIHVDAILCWPYFTDRRALAKRKSRWHL